MSDPSSNCHWKDALGQVPYWPDTLRLIWTAAPRSTVVWIGFLLLQGLLPAILVYMTKLIIDALVSSHNAGGAWEHAPHVLLLLVLTAAAFLLSDVLQSAIEWVRVAQSERIHEHIRGLIQRKATSLDLAFYETPEYFNLLEQVRSEAGSRPIVLLESFGGLIQNGLTLCAMGALLISYGPWLPVVLLLSAVPAFFVVVSYERNHYHWWQTMTPERRWAQYYDAVLTHIDSAAEIRLFDLSKHFLSKYQALRARLINERLSRMKRLIFQRSAASFIALLVSGAAIGVIALRVLNGRATLGDLALFYGAFSQGQSLMRSLLGTLSQIVSNSLYLKNLFRFLELEPKIVDPLKPQFAPKLLRSGISFQSINFAYPGSSRLALRNFSLFVPAGKIVAIVGANGAGKSTLLKLLCRLYDVDEGGIEVDGIDVRCLRLAELRQMITVLFQFPVQYQGSARENIGLGDLANMNIRPAIVTAATNAGAHEMISQLRDGYDAVLGKWFANGEELSGGEWQRIALARAYLRRSPIIILDEPTSFMDSWCEADWFARFRALAKGRTAIVITHRFTIAMRADIIHVMEDGGIVESGSHQDLINQDGLYAQSWLSQMQTSGNLARA